MQGANVPSNWGEPGFCWASLAVAKTHFPLIGGRPGTGNTASFAMSKVIFSTSPALLSKSTPRHSLPDFLFIVGQGCLLLPNVSAQLNSMALHRLHWRDIGLSESFTGADWVRTECDQIKSAQLRFKGFDRTPWQDRRVAALVWRILWELVRPTATSGKRKQWPVM